MSGYNEKADIWSLACSAYELLTGSVLFDPEKDKNYSTDFYHIYWIIELMGDIPKSLITKSKCSSNFFHPTGKFKEKKPLLHSLTDVFDDVSVSVSSSTIELLNNMLIINPQDRFSYEQIINWIDTKY
jgi:serine/threonine-protein kinase SRPK3